MATLLISAPHQAIAHPEIGQPTLRLASGSLIEFANLQFVPADEPDFDRDVLQPLRKAQEATAAKAEADRTQGALDQLLVRLKDEFGCKDLKEAKALLAQLRTKRDTAQTAFANAVDDYERKWKGDL